MKIFAGLKLHPNGFLGAPLEYRSAHASRPIQVDLIGTATRKVTLETEDNTVTPNTFIEELFEQAISHELIVARNFAFRERVYKEALRAFGTITINEWIEKQKQNPYFDSMQNRFVEETVGYVFTGFRKYHPMVYVETLDIGEYNAFEIGPNVRNYLLNFNGQQSMLIRDFLQQWLTQRDGMSDMLFTLRVLFGS